jgi:hypothetical protein
MGVTSPYGGGVTRGVYPMRIAQSVTPYTGVAGPSEISMRTSTMYQGGVLGYPFAPDSHAGDPLESGKPMIFIPTVIMTSDVAHPAPRHVVMAQGPTRSGVGWRMSRQLAGALDLGVAFGSLTLGKCGSTGSWACVVRPSGLLPITPDSESRGVTA